MDVIDRGQHVAAYRLPWTVRRKRPHAMAIALICAFCATALQAEEIVINHYTHRGCATGSGERLLPIFALQGYLARVPKGAYWDCETVINSATLSCEQAVKAPYSRQNEQYPECLSIFAAEVPVCLAHYENERHKCTDVGRSSTEAAGLDASERRRVQQALAAAGFNPGPADGVFGPKTRRAIQAWQQANGYAASGELTKAQVEALLGGTGALEPFGPNWIITENQPCQVYNDVPEPEETATWSGGCGNGKALGEGRLVWRGSDGESTYQGTMREGKVHGHGIFTWPDGGRYEGEWRDGDQHGHGTEFWADGDRYEGEYRNNKRHGRGTYIRANGDRYEGEWRDGDQHGHGTQFWAGGDRYEGEYRNNKKHGRGTYTWATGDRYEGEWQNDKEHGRGTFTRPDGSRYVGGWRDEEKHGHGVLTHGDGTRHEGEYRNGKPNGYGTFTFADGLRLQGQWRNGCFKDWSGWAVVDTTPAACGFQ